MDATLYIEILEKMLIPFVESVYPDSHHLIADNVPKHTSNAAKVFLSSKKSLALQSPLIVIQ